MIKLKENDNFFTHYYKKLKILFEEKKTENNEVIRKW